MKRSKRTKPTSSTTSSKSLLTRFRRRTALPCAPPWRGDLRERINKRRNGQRVLRASSMRGHGATVVRCLIRHCARRLCPPYDEYVAGVAGETIRKNECVTAIRDDKPHWRVWRSCASSFCGHPQQPRQTL